MSISFNSIGRILIVDDDEATRTLLSQVLTSKGLHIDEAAGLPQMWDKLASVSVDVVLLDMQLGEDDALEALPSLIRKHPHTRVLIVTGNGSIETAVEAMQLGASGYVTKPIDFQKLLTQLSAILPSKQPVGRDGATAAPLAMEDAGIVGVSQALQSCWQQVLRMKDVDSTVLILGESGTGKELIARALHNLSKRTNSRFGAINCGAIPSELLESELFGHRKGSFTDAKTDKKGLFELCSDGTLFLDEVGELPLMQQTKLLRVLQEREVTPIGAGHSIKINTRIVAATNISLPDAVKENKFREDLLFRLSVLVIHVPPLRARRDDIPFLVRHFVNHFSLRFGIAVEPPSSELLARLSLADWPGNIRQLQNAIERGVVLAQGGMLRYEDIMGEQGFGNVANEAPVAASANLGNEMPLEPLSKAKEHFEADYLAQLLTATKGNVSEAARISGRYRADLYRLFSRYNIDPSNFKPGRPAMPSSRGESRAAEGGRERYSAV